MFSGNCSLKERDTLQQFQGRDPFSNSGSDKEIHGSGVPVVNYREKLGFSSPTNGGYN